MSDQRPPDDMVRQVLREALDKVLPELLQERNGNGNGHGPAHAAPQPEVSVYPPPPVAAVHRPSGWHAPAHPEAAGPAPTPAQSTPAGSDSPGTVEDVTVRNDAELDAFVRRLLHLFENPRDRLAIRSGRLRFRLRETAHAAQAAPAASAARRVERGAVTERIVNEAAAAGERLVLAPRAVLTPMARDRARQLGVEISREPRC